MTGRRLLRYGLGGLLLGLSLSCLAAWVWSQRLWQPYQQWNGTEVVVDIPPGASPRAIGKRLVDAGVVRDEWTFRAGLLVTGQARALKAGEYRFDAPVSAAVVIDRLARGDVFRRLLTFPEGLTIEEMARIYAESGFGPAEDFVAAAQRVDLVRDLDPEAPDLEGYLYPESYALPRQTPAATLVRLMVEHFKRAFDERLQASARAQGLTVRQTVTLASLVEKETARAEERSLVAAVYRNRLRVGMGMQADPTVIYALQRAGRYDGNISRADLTFDSPYNTYVYAGLPPGPIAAPSRASIEAVLAPADVQHLYFVSRNDGSHVFADTLEGHNRNVFEWQVKFFRDRRDR